MATPAAEVDFGDIRDPQRLVALLVGVVLILVGIAGVTTVLHLEVLGDGLVLGLFGIPLWLALTAVVAGLLGILLSLYAGGATTFNKVAAGLVLPAVFLLAVVDWALATGSTAALVLGVFAFLVAVVLVVVGVFLLRGNWLAFVFPIVALLAILDWALEITAGSAAGAVNPATLGLLFVLAVGLGLVGFEGGRRLT